MSPYARSLMHLMQAAPTELERAKAEVLLACYWARVGDIPAADEIRKRSRSMYPSGMYAELTILHMCLDGLMHYYAEQSPAAVERLKSAHALAATYRFRSEQAFSAVWLAHVEFNQDHWDATFDALHSCLAALDIKDTATQGRLSLVVADSLLHAGEVTQSKAWYDKARLLFASIGDHAAIEAFLYNSAALRLHGARLKSIYSEISAEDVMRLGGEIANATNYQRITNQRSLEYLLDVATASHKIILKDYAGARQVIDSLLQQGEIPRASKAPPLLLADKALCEVNLESPERGTAALATAEASIPASLPADDLAIIAHTLSQAHLLAGNDDSARSWAVRRDQAVRDFEAVRTKLRSLLTPWNKDPSSVLPSAN